MHSNIATLKAGYATLSVLFTWLFAGVLLVVLVGKADLGWVARMVAPLGVVSASLAWLGWSVSRRLGLSRARAAAVAVGSIIGGVNLAVFVWLMFKRAPADPASA